MPKALIAGRGGCGKSTITALLAHALSLNGKVTVVDADESNLALGLMLGMKDPEGSLMDFLGGKTTVRNQLRETMRSEGAKTLSFFKDIKVADLPEAYAPRNENVTWLRIGKIEHSMEGCACPMGFVARDFLKSLATGPDDWVLIDTEAGVEHFGRGVLEGVDLVLTVVEPSREAIILAERARDFCAEAGKKCIAALNKVKDQEQLMRDEMENRGIPIVGVMPVGDDVALLNLRGEPLTADASLFPEVRRMAEDLRTLGLSG
jgi:CO dehydrogenase maturation factor